MEKLCLSKIGIFYTEQLSTQCLMLLLASIQILHQFEEGKGVPNSIVLFFFLAQE